MPSVEPATEERPPGTAPGWPWARTVTAICAVFCLLQYVAWEPALVAPSFMLVLGLACLAFVTWLPGSTHALPLATWLMVVAGLAGVLVMALKSEFLALWPPGTVLAALVLIACALVASLTQGRRACGASLAV